jgi:hypothetical protein
MTIETAQITHSWDILGCCRHWDSLSIRKQILLSTKGTPTKFKIRQKNCWSSVRGNEISETSTNWKRRARGSTRRKWAPDPTDRAWFVRSGPSRALAQPSQCPARANCWPPRMTKLPKIKPKSTSLTSRTRPCSSERPSPSWATRSRSQLVPGLRRSSPSTRDRSPAPQADSLWSLSGAQNLRPSSTWNKIKRAKNRWRISSTSQGKSLWVKLVSIPKMRKTRG